MIVREIGKYEMFVFDALRTFVKGNFKFEISISLPE